MSERVIVFVILKKASRLYLLCDLLKVLFELLDEVQRIDCSGSCR